MHSHLRAQKGQQIITEYCPLDLFSGNEERVLNAIRCLWNAWVASDATVNNLKIFAGGKFVKPSDVSFHSLDCDPFFSQSSLRFILSTGQVNGFG